MNQAKIYDIAGAAGVSLATVSRVLNHPEKVKEATRNKVLRIIKEKGYKPNANARGLASRRSTTVAIVVPRISQASVAEMIQGIDDSAKKLGYTIRLFINSNPKQEQELWGEVIASSVDGVLLMNDEMTQETAKLLQYAPVPVLFVNAIPKSDKFGSVCIDYQESAYNITKKMIERGSKNIMFVGTEHKYTVNDLKLSGYVKAMEESKLPTNIVFSSGDIAINEKHFMQIVENKLPEVALFVRDSMAISFMNIATKKGYHIPSDIQVIGFQNTKYAELANPKLTCVETPIYEIGNRAMAYLTELMKENGTHEKPKHILVDYKMIWRESTK